MAAANAIIALTEVKAREQIRLDYFTWISHVLALLFGYVLDGMTGLFLVVSGAIALKYLR